MNKPSDVFMLDDVCVMPAHNEISALGKTLHLQPRAMEVLCYLAQHHQRVVANDELIEQVWRGRVVTPGSVQKSINLIRKAFTELLGDQEVIAHYSKRGYQLQCVPVHCPDEALPVRQALIKRRLWWVVSMVLVLALGSSYWYANRYTLLIDKSPLPPVTQLDSYMDSAAYVHSAEPHSNGRHLAYVSEARTEAGGFSSDLIIRDNQQREWLLASSSGSWQMLNWSPSGKHLLAVESAFEGVPWQGFSSVTGSAQLYDIHVFSVDVNVSRVQEKHRLSQWYGTINSVSWWDDDTLDMVARQGETAVNQRYRYSLPGQRLDRLDALAFVSHPLLGRSFQQHTALASEHHGATRIDFLAPNQQRYAQARINYRVVDLTWLPDGGGVLVSGAENEPLHLVFRDGSTVSVDVPHQRDSYLSRPRLSNDGQRIFFTRTQPRAGLELISPEGVAQPLADRRYFNYAARFSPDGERIAYATVRNNQAQIHLLEKDASREFDVSAPVRHLVWGQDGRHLLFKAGDDVYLHRLDDSAPRVLLGEAGDVMPVAIDVEQQQLLALRQTSEVNNLWRIGYHSGEEKQLTFGALASVIVANGVSYFQYAGQEGLWTCCGDNDELVRFSHQLERNSHLLAIDDEGVYYTRGQGCNTSAIIYHRFADESRAVYFDSAKANQAVVSLHPQQGAIYSACEPVLADIVYADLD
ncbi:MAG TPA: winged helix-turn-helix domain-containing protein [Cellvibrionaceae bacterium]